LQQCRWELDQAARLMRQADIPSLNTTHVSIEEIASKIFSRFGIERTMF
jgi:regulator of PEP synthase PpsR (kinase-PPPase family)